ncbi:MAG: hypothetical protein P1P86_04390 [Bacteroidales bacterium]|nr:hypothetical protein [Bacteroidales bacterium]
MIELDKKEMIIRYSAIAFVLGAVLTIIQYALLLYARDAVFSFRLIASLHNDLPLLYLLDLLALPSLYFGARIAGWCFKQMDTLAQRIRQETAKNEEFRQFTNALIA